MERINGLGLAENELRDLREDNALARERELQRITNATNTFADERIRAEQRAAQEEQRLLEQTRRERERAEAQALRDAERAARERERLAERAARKEARAAEQAARDRIANERRIIEERRALDQNVVQRAQFALGDATGEADFERRRQAAIQATQEYYDLELERIEATEASEERLQDLREDNLLARERALRSLENTTNRFADERIRAEERAATDAIRETERAEREQLRAAESAAAERLRIQERLEADIDRLRDQEIANAERRADAIVDIEEDKQDRLEELELDRLRRSEDAQTAFRRGLEDIFRDAGFDEGFFRTGDQNVLATAASPDQDVLRRVLDRFGVDASEGDLGRIRDLAVRQQRAGEDIETRRARQEFDIRAQAEDRRAEIEAQASANAVAIANELSPLLQEITSAITSTFPSGTDSLQNAGEVLATSGEVLMGSGMELSGAGSTSQVAGTDLIEAGGLLQTGANSLIENARGGFEGSELERALSALAGTGDISARNISLVESLARRGVANPLEAIYGEREDLPFTSTSDLRSTIDAIYDFVNAPILDTPTAPTLPTEFRGPVTVQADSVSLDGPVTNNVEVTNTVEVDANLNLPNREVG